MANVPRYEELPNRGGGFASSGPSNSAFAAQSVRNTAWLDTINVAGRTANDIIGVAVELDNVKNENLYNQTILDYRHATDTMALELKQRQGINAQGNTDEFKAYTTKLRNEYAAKIADNRWRGQFIDQTRQMDHSLGMNLASDESNKTYKAQNDLLQSRVSLAADEVGMFLDDPNRLPGAVDALRAANYNLYRNTGASDEVIAQQNEELVSRTLAQNGINAAKLGNLSTARNVLNSGWLLQQDSDNLKLSIRSEQKRQEAESRQKLMVSTALMRENLQKGIFMLEQGDDSLINQAISDIEGSLTAQGFKIEKGSSIIATPPDELVAAQRVLDLAANAPGTPDAARTAPNLLANFIDGQAPQIQLDLSSVSGDVFKTSWGRSQYDLLKQGYIARDSQNLFSYWQEMPLESARASLTEYQNSLDRSDPDYMYKQMVVDTAKNMYDNMVANVSQDPAAYMAERFRMTGLDSMSINSVDSSSLKSRQETIQSTFPWLPRQPVLSATERQGYKQTLLSAAPEERMNLLFNLSERMGPEYRGQAFRELGLPTQILDSIMAMGYDTVYNQEAQRLLDIWALPEDDIKAIRQQTGVSQNDARTDLAKNSYEYQYWQNMLQSNYNVPDLRAEAIRNLDFMETQYYLAGGDVDSIVANESAYDYYNNGAALAKMPAGKYANEQVSYGLYAAKDMIKPELTAQARAYAETTGQNPDFYEVAWGQHFDDNVVAFRIPGYSNMFAWFDKANGQALLNDDGSLRTIDLDQLYENTQNDFDSYTRLVMSQQAQAGITYIPQNLRLTGRKY